MGVLAISPACGCLRFPSRQSWNGIENDANTQSKGTVKFVYGSHAAASTPTPPKKSFLGHDLMALGRMLCARVGWEMEEGRKEDVVAQKQSPSVPEVSRESHES